MIDVRELLPGETNLAFNTMRELRTHLTTPEAFVEQVDLRQRPEGFRLVGSFIADEAEPLGVAGFRLQHTLAWGTIIYVDDLVTRAVARSQGHGAQLIAWLITEARRQGCAMVHLDSGVQRFDAHRFYLTQRMRISAHHFDIAID